MINETHSTDGAGFVRFGDIVRSRVGGTASERVKRGFGGDVIQVRSSPKGCNALKKMDQKAFSGKVGQGVEEGGLGGGTEGRGERASQTVDISAFPPEIERVAAHLASALRDEQSLDYYRLVARVLPREVVRDALVRALDARDVRRSRGALFAHIVAPSLKAHRRITHSRTP